MSTPKRVLITGTTSGIGLSLYELYVAKGVEVITVNQREFASLHNHVLDITSLREVTDLLLKLKMGNELPELLILNAGINRVDNATSFDFEIFSEVVNTNLFGALTFVSAVQSLGLTQLKIAVMSSTSNIVPNPGHLGYYLSKLALHETVHLLRKKDPRNHYQSVILGPVRTQISRNFPAPSGIQKFILKLLEKDALAAAQRCVRFFEGAQDTLYYPLSSVVFYYFVRLALIFVPSLYSGTVINETRRVPSEI